MPIALDVLLEHGGRAARSWGTGGRVLFLCLLLTYLIGARAHEVFENDSGQVHLVHCLTRGDKAFFESSRELDQHVRHLATRVEFLFQGNKGDQSQQGCVLMRTRDTAIGPNFGLEKDGGAVALMVELLSYNSTLPESACISAYFDCGVMRVWSYRQATSALRQVASLAGMNPKEVSLHSLRIGMATVLGAGGDTSDGVI